MTTKAKRNLVCFFCRRPFATRRYIEKHISTAHADKRRVSNG